MTVKKPYTNIPGTKVFDGHQARIGYHLNQFCMSLMQAENRIEFLQDEAKYLDKWPLSEQQKNAVMARDYRQMIEHGGNIYFLVKITATDGKSVLHAVSTMTNLNELEYAEMMRLGGRGIAGNRYIEEIKYG